MSILQWPDALRGAGCSVFERPGWRNNQPQGGLSSPLKGLFWHHDATPAGSTPGGWGWICQSYDAGQPSAQLWMDIVGQWRFAGSGYASHAGVVGGSLSSKNCVGLETDHTSGENYTSAQTESLHRGFAAICKVEGRGSDFITFHKIEASPHGRKQDPWFKPGFDYAEWQRELGVERRVIQNYIDLGGVVIPPPPVVEDEMNDQDWVRLEAIVERAVDKRIKVHFGADAVQNPDAALNAGVSARFRADIAAEMAKLGKA